MWRVNRSTVARWRKGGGELGLRGAQRAVTEHKRLDHARGMWSNNLTVLPSAPDWFHSTARGGGGGGWNIEHLSSSLLVVLDGTRHQRFAFYNYHHFVTLDWEVQGWVCVND